MIVEFLSIIISIIFSFLLFSPEYDFSFQKYFLVNWKYIFLGFLTVFLPLCFFSPMIDYFFFLGLVLTVITDCVDHSVFTIVPLLLILKQIIFFGCSGSWGLLANMTGYSVFACFCYRGISFLYYRFFDVAQVGGGDVLFILASCWYFSFLEVVLGIYCGCLYALLAVLVFRLTKKNRQFLRGMPFIPFFYLGMWTVLTYDGVSLFYSYLW